MYLINTNLLSGFMRRRITRIPVLFLFFLVLVMPTSCKNDDGPDNPGNSELPDEYYVGGKLGTTTVNNISTAYEQPTPAIDQAGMGLTFMIGESYVEKSFNTNTSGKFFGLGPVYERGSCVICHPGYGHSKRTEKINSKEYGSGYHLRMIDKDTEEFVPEMTHAVLTHAVAPFLPPVDEKGIKIDWKEHTDEFGNKFPDGETYSLIYPEVTIDPAYINTDPKPANYVVKIQSSLPLYGTGLIDAIPTDSILAEYQRQKARGRRMNDAIYDPANYHTALDGTKHPGRFSYNLSFAPLQGNSGATFLWGSLGITNPHFRHNDISEAYARAMSRNKDVQEALGKDEEAVYAELMRNDLPIEMDADEYASVMIWQRGLAVPAARNLDDPEVQKGKKAFYSIGCTSCHRPSWTTGPDEYKGDPLVTDKLPRYPYQKIWPYSDLMHHRLEMVNDIHTGWCRTSPLWGRGLSQLCSGNGDHLHDMRARNYTEAIMWHGGDAKFAKDKFRDLSKEDRDALVKFLESI